jgi:hypothetical protein
MTRNGVRSQVINIKYAIIKISTEQECTEFKMNCMETRSVKLVLLQTELNRTQALGYFKLWSLIVKFSSRCEHRTSLVTVSY